MRTRFVFFITVFFFMFLFSTVGFAEGSSSYIIINKSKNQLAYFVGDELIKVFPVATGKTKNLTPEGTFSIIVKLKNPYYNKGKIPGGDPRNPLGDRWLGLSVPGTSGGTYGIHGNSNPASIGTYASAGCVRMYEKDVAWIYDQVPKGTKVHIVSSKKNFVQLAAQFGHQVTAVVSTQPAKPKPKVDPIKSFKFQLMVDEKDTELPKEVSGLIVKGKSLLPLKSITDLLGYKYQLDSSKKIITLQKNKLELKLELNKKEMMKYDKNIPLDLEPQIVKENVYVSPTTITQIVENDSMWDSKANKLTLRTNDFYPYIKQIYTNLDQYAAIFSFFLIK